MPFVAVILLAAGESSRMGRQKALVTWEGTTLLEYQLAQLHELRDIQQIIVVTGHEPDSVTAIASRSPRVVIAHNRDYASGKVSSIITGVRAVSPDADAIMVLAVDQPRPAWILQALLASQAEEGAPIAVPVRGGRRGHPVVIHRALLGELAMITEATLGLREILRRHDADVLEVEIDDPAIHVDLNVPADLA